MSSKGAFITVWIKLFPSLIILTANSFLLEDRHCFALGLPEHSPVQTEKSHTHFSTEELAALSEEQLLIFLQTHGVWRSSDIWH